MNTRIKFSFIFVLILGLAFFGLIAPKQSVAQTYYPYYPYQNNSGFCYNFTTNLQIGSTGADVEALHTALSREGFIRNNSWSGSNQTFDEQTASLVSGFQEKYRYDILTPVGYQNGTGFVGSYTRNKLNALFNSYNCNNGGTNNNNNLSFTITSNKGSYNYGEDIILTLTAKNNSNYERVLNFNSGCQTNYKIGTYDSGSNQACTLALTSVRIPAYNSYSWSMTHRQYNFNLTQGTYSVTGRVIGYGEANTTITIGYSGGNNGNNSGTNYPRVVSPNGGEYLRRGNYQNISWLLPQVTYFQAQAVDVSLVPTNYSYNNYQPYYSAYSNSTCPVGSTCAYTGSNYGQTYYPYGSNYYPNNQYPYNQYASSYTILQDTLLSSFNWYVGSTPNSWSGIPSGTYRLQVCLTGTSVCDTSDNYFTLSDY